MGRWGGGDFKSPTRRRLYFWWACEGVAYLQGSVWCVQSPRLKSKRKRRDIRPRAQTLTSGIRSYGNHNMLCMAVGHGWLYRWHDRNKTRRARASAIIHWNWVISCERVLKPWRIRMHRANSMPKRVAFCEVVSEISIRGQWGSQVNSSLVTWPQTHLYQAHLCRPGTHQVFEDDTINLARQDKTMIEYGIVDFHIPSGGAFKFLFNMTIPAGNICEVTSTTWASKDHQMPQEYLWSGKTWYFTVQHLISQNKCLLVIQMDVSFSNVWFLHRMILLHTVILTYRET